MEFGSNRRWGITLPGELGLTDTLKISVTQVTGVTVCSNYMNLLNI